MAKMNEEKAKILYDFLDESKMFRGTVEKEFRSLMNVPFVTASKETDAEVVAATKAAGFEGQTSRAAKTSSAVCVPPFITQCPRKALLLLLISSANTSRKITKAEPESVCCH